MKIQIGGLSIAKESKPPYYNKAFSLDLPTFSALDRINRNNHSMAVRMAVKHYADRNLQDMLHTEKALLDRIEVLEARLIMYESQNNDQKSGILAKLMRLLGR
tara:strand:- start:1476 stop:1784 length:309 start_codon:yes stop_codon:yes gene_type:complete